MTTNEEKVFCTWNDGPVVEAWRVGMGRPGHYHQVEVCCRRPATEAEVRDHASRLYGTAYGPIRGVIRRAAVPNYCADRPAAICPPAGA
jgi:hypothetical protein